MPAAVVPPLSDSHATDSTGRAPDPAFPPGPRLAQLPTGPAVPEARAAFAQAPFAPADGVGDRPARPLSRRIAAVRKLHGVRRRATWRQRLVEAERGLVLGFRRDGVLAGHVFVLTLAVAAGVVFELNTSRWCIIFLALGGAMAAELFGLVIAALAAAVVRDGEAESERNAQLAGAVRLCSAAIAVAACGACAALVAVFTPAVVEALGG